MNLYGTASLAVYDARSDVSRETQTGGKMRLPFMMTLALLGIAAAQTPPAQTAPAPKPAAHAMAMKPVMLTPSDVQWMAAPAATGMPAGIQMAVLSGDPSKPGIFAVRIKIPDGGKIAAHWHPTDEYVTVVEGTFAAGMGDQFEEAGLHEFPVGSYVLMPRRMHHFGIGKGDTVLQIFGQGPFVLNYVNPADDPRKK
jgi:quercetin dioxygenase-like cupin family protein